MPCRDPRDNMSWADVERCNDRWEKEYRELKRDYDKLTDMICAVFTDMDNRGQTAHINNPESREWWMNHKAEDAARLKREQEVEAASRLQVQTAITYMERYKEMLSKNDLLPDDKKYFEERMVELRNEIAQAFDRFPGIAKEYV